MMQAETESNKLPFDLPEGWSEESLNILADINPESLGGGTPASFQFRYIDISSVEHGVINWNDATTQTFADAPSRARRVVRPKDTLLCTVRPALQAHTFADWQDKDGVICSTGFAVIRAKNQNEPRYLYHQIFSDYVAAQIRRLEIGSSYPAINENDVKSLVIAAAPPPEQRRIAEVLDANDAAIQRTDTLINKLKWMKMGLLHDLLTRGLDRDGKLRDPVRHPEQFQNEPLVGLIPIDWEVITLGKVGKWLSGGTPNKSIPSYWNGTIPWVSPKDMKRFYIDDSADHVSELGAMKGTRKVSPNTILIVVRGMVLAHTLPIGLTIREVTFNQDIKAIICSDTVLPLYFAFWLEANSSKLINLVTESTHGTKRFDMVDLLKLNIALPKDLKEQEKITEILRAQDTAINTEEANRDKLIHIKRGIMHDLLTGRVPVPATKSEVVAV